MPTYTLNEEGGQRKELIVHEETLRQDLVQSELAGFPDGQHISFSHAAELVPFSTRLPDESVIAVSPQAGVRCYSMLQT